MGGCFSQALRSCTLNLAHTLTDDTDCKLHWKTKNVVI